MFMGKDIIINKYEVALFPKDFYISDLDILLEELKEEVDIFSEGNTVKIPIPTDAPRDIPRLILRSKNNSIVCNFGFDKVNIVWLNLRELSSFSVSIGEIQRIIEKLSNVILRHTPPPSKMKRIGYIKEIFFLSTTPSKEISRTIFKEKLIENLKSFIFRLSYSIKLEQLECNDVTSIGDGIKHTGDKEKVIMVMKDINTLPNTDMSWNATQIKKFISNVDAILEKNDIYKNLFT
jgi:hypothetical protein